MNREKHKGWVAKKSENFEKGYPESLLEDITRQKEEYVREAFRTGNTLAAEEYGACDPVDMLERLKEVQREITEEDMYVAAMRCATVIPNGGELLVHDRVIRTDSNMFLTSAVLEIAKKLGKNLKTTSSPRSKREICFVDDWLLSGVRVAGYANGARGENCRLKVFVAGATNGGIMKVKVAGGEMVDINVVKRIPSVKDVLTEPEYEIVSGNLVSLADYMSGAVHKFRDSDFLSSGKLLTTERQLPYPKDVVGWVDRFWKGEKEGE